MIKTRKATKRALFMSFVSMFLCFTMLLGTTYAWFTDSVTSATNQIVAGNLDVELEYATFNEDGSFKEWAAVNEDVKLFDDNAKWEPGHTEIAYLKVSNLGTLALKYQLSANFGNETPGVNVNGDPFKLSDYLVFKVVELDDENAVGTYTRESAIVAAGTEMGLETISGNVHELAAKTEQNTDADYVALIIYMPTIVDNEANYKTGTTPPSIELGVNLFATQKDAESDSFGSDYDKEASIIVTSPAVALPAVGETATEQILTTAAKNSMTLTLSSEFLGGIADAYASSTEEAPVAVALSHSEPKIDADNNTIKFDYVELVDENGDIIDLEALDNDNPITVKFNVGDAFNVGDTVIVYHDGEIFATPEVDADKNITYTATHFCEVTVGYNDGKIDNLIELENTIKHANNGDTVVFGGNITSEDGILIKDQNLTIDLNGYTFTVSKGSSTSNRNFKIIGTSVVTIKNGTMIAGDNAYGTVRTEGQANVTLENLKLYNKLGGGLNVKVVTGTNVTINNCEIYSQYGGGVEASGGNIVLNNTKIEQKGSYDNGWYSVAMEINGGGKITVNSGEYSGSAIATDANASRGNCVAFILSSGGTLDINGGTFNGVVAETADVSNFCGLIYADRAAVVNIYGGEFISNGAILDMRNNAGTQPNPVATIYGGKFSADPTVSGLYSSNLIKLAESCYVEAQDGYYTVIKDESIVVTTAEEFVEAIANVTEEGTKIKATGVTVDINAIGVEQATGKKAFSIPSGVTIEGLSVVGTYRGGNYFFFEGSPDEEIVFENCTFELSGRTMGLGFLGVAGGARSVVYNNCTFKGAVILEFPDSQGVATYNNCTFTKATSGNTYIMAIGGTHEFNECTFDYTGLTQSNMGIVDTAAINVCSESDGSNSTTVILNGCTRISCGTRKYGANSTLTIK